MTITICNLVKKFFNLIENWKKKLAKSINEKSSNLIGKIEKKIDNYEKKNIKRKIVNKKFSNLLTNCIL